MEWEEVTDIDKFAIKYEILSDWDCVLFYESLPQLS